MKAACARWATHLNTDGEHGGHEVVVHCRVQQHWEAHPMAVVARVHHLLMSGHRQRLLAVMTTNNVTRIMLSTSYQISRCVYVMVKSSILNHVQHHKDGLWGSVEAVAYRGGDLRGSNPPPPRNSEILTKYQKLRKFHDMKWNFLYQITAASRTPD
jgi:hypothetical protein